MRTVLAVLLVLNTASFAVTKDGERAPFPEKFITASGAMIVPAGYAKSLKKQNLLLLFYRTGTCSVCVGQLADVAQVRDEILKWNTAILAVSMDDAILQSQTKEKIGDSYPLVLDPEGHTIKAFGVFNPSDKLSRPAVFLIGPNRKVLYHYVGQSIGDRPSIETILHAVKHYSGLFPGAKRAGKG